MDKPLLPLTKLLLGLWALITIPGGLLLLFWHTFATQLVWPLPLPEIPFFHAQMSGALGIGTGVACALALRQNTWRGAMPLIGMFVAYAIAAEYVAITTMISLGSAPLQLWFYVILGVFYLGSSFYIWSKQS